MKLSRNKSILKAIKILETLAGKTGGLSLTQIARQAGINKATALRILTTLRESGFIEREDGRYVLGTRLFLLGNKAPIKKNIIDRVHPHLRRLAFEFKETANLAELCFGTVHYLDKIETPRSLRISTFVGARLPIHCTALGKAIIAFLPGDKRDAILRDFLFEKMTSNTITQKEEFLEELAKIRERGYSVDNEEFEEGLRCVAVPLFLEDLNFFGAISISGPSRRITVEAIPRIAEVLKGEVDAIKEELLSKK